MNFVSVCVDKEQERRREDKMKREREIQENKKKCGTDLCGTDFLSHDRF